MEENKNKVDTRAPAKKGPVFSLERLAQDCHELFNVTPSTFAGATCGLKEDCQMTVPEMQEHIKKWLDTPIKIGGRRTK